MSKTNTKLNISLRTALIIMVAVISVFSLMTPVDAGAAEGRYKVDGANCYFDPNDSGPDQCDPNATVAPTGRYKLDGNGGCVWDATDTGPNQCDPNAAPEPAPAPAPTGRYKLDGNGGCVWDATDTGPNQCDPSTTPTPAPIPSPTPAPGEGRYKIDGWNGGGCYFAPGEDGPNQCDPSTSVLLPAPSPMPACDFDATLGSNITSRVNSGQIIPLVLNEDKTSWKIINNTNCDIKLDIAAYEMHTNTTLENQTLFSHSGLVTIPAHSERNITTSAPSCNYQVDIWTTTAPTTLESGNPYPNLANGFYVVTPAGFCPPIVTPPTTGTITVVKTVVNDNGGTKNVSDFSLFINSTQVTSGQANTLPVGTYTISETQLAGYTGTIGGACSSSGTVTISAGENVTCTIVNNDDAVIGFRYGKLTVLKNVINDNGGTLGVLDFQLFINNEPVPSGQVNNLPVGTYTVRENQRAGYVGSFSGACDSNGVVNLTAGQDVTCIITNNDIGVTPPATGKITFCLVLADHNGGVVSSAAGLPAGVFSINLLSSNTPIHSKLWSTATFSPNQRFILPAANDAECITYSNLPLGNYNYSQLAVTGANWQVAKYNDQDTMVVNDVSDFFNYGANSNSDGAVSLTTARPEQTIVIFEVDDEGQSCPAPQITSALSGSAVVGQPFTYTITGTSSTAVNYSAANLPPGLSFNSTTNTISGIPTQAGSFNINLYAVNTCVGGIDSEILVLNIVNPGTITPPPYIPGIPVPTPTANLSISKTVNKTLAYVGEQIVYTLTVRNVGPDGASGVVVTDFIPTGVNFSSYTSTMGSYNNQTGQWTIGSLGNGGVATLTIYGTVREGYQGQTITNYAIVSLIQYDPYPADNSARVDFVVGQHAGCTSNCSVSADVAVTKTQDKTNPGVLENVTYVIRVQNNGPQTATNVVLTDLLPSSLSYVSATVSVGSYYPATGRWDIGTLNVGASATFTITGQVKAGSQGQAITNIATVTATEFDPNLSNNTARVNLTVKSGVIQLPNTSIAPAAGSASAATTPREATVEGAIAQADDTSAAPATVSDTTNNDRQVAAAAFAVGTVCEWINWLLLLIIVVMGYLWYRDHEAMKVSGVK